MTDRELFLRCAEMLTGSGIREVGRLVQDVNKLYKAAKEYPDDDDKPRRGRPPKADIGEAA